ncbi:MAG TPA: PQQ-binding-like beta-propeller repeat protein [Spirochaetota bacterium]|nr:PQQ-binding-like beta-propeller repeat protein [Spirochaetota bacterium]
MLRKNLFFILFVIISGLALHAEDWPIYKGNIYFTGNNDEITVKNNNLKWLFQADNVVLNPIVSDGRVYFLDLKKQVYCLDEERGRLLWKVSLMELSSQFRASGKSFGKGKYPLIRGNRLFITDNIALYCLDKRTGRVIWARTGMRSDDPNLKKDTGKYVPLKDRTDPVRGSGNWRGNKSTYAMVDSIYSDPVIIGDVIYYGTRNELISREIVNGHMLWNNDQIKSWSKFPSFYDEYMFTQSMDYQRNTYSLYCLKADTGKTVWVKRVTNPHRIYPPVVYRRRVYFASGENLHAIDLKTGELLWSKQYSGLITSNPSFTDRAILFTVNNGTVVVTDPENGNVLNSLEFGEQKAPYFVTIRDQIYVATTFDKNIGGRSIPWARLESFNITGRDEVWEYSPQFPGAPSQPVASGGIMFLPAGNYLYAIGTDYYPRIVDGGDGYYDPYNRLGDEKEVNKDELKKLKEETAKKETEKKKDPVMPMKDLKITVQDDTGHPIPATVEVRKWDKGKLIFSKRYSIKNPDQVIKVPDMNDVEITADSTGYMPEKVITSRSDKDKQINLKKIETGKGIVVDNIHFEVGKAYLRKESLNILDSIIRQMKRNPGIKLEVRGHTDSSGGKAYNQKLSERRADAVTEYMIKQGISPERLKSVGFGENKPVATNKTSAGRKKNRRTEFFVTGK